MPSCKRKFAEGDILWSMGIWGCLLLCVSTLSVDYYRYLSPPRNPIVEDKELFQGLSLRMDLRALELKHSFLYMRNRVHGEMEPSQFRLIGWQYEVGIRAGPIEVYQGHHSQHLLDMQGSQRFPVEDLVGIRLILIDR